ncbi:MAG: hypothetical protein J0M05_11805 [Candidatus Kapabacteria bacterium]|jgi:hypothetical protein|nr:hypothetical protein [Candidatus Kapabacteria bacterium]
MAIKIAAFIVLCTLFSCKSYLIFNTINKLHKGMTKEAVLKVLEDKPVKEFTVTVNGQTYDVYDFEVKTYSNLVGMSGGTNSFPLYQDNIDDYYLLYFNGKLRYWGTLVEYSETEDYEISVISKELYNKVNLLNNVK